MLAQLVMPAAKRTVRFCYRYTISYIRTREEFPHILNSRGLLGEGVEVGVQTGHFSEHILAHWGGKRLYSVDPWREFGKEYSDVSNVSNDRHEQFYQQTVAKLSRFGQRSVVMRLTSREAAEHFQNGQLDFAYLDAQHHYEAVKDDIALWYPKIRAGGILAGHDYMDGTRSSGTYGVKSAVDQFCKELGVGVFVSREPDWRSWFVIKPK
jgi:hypothetical protein